MDDILRLAVSLPSFVIYGIVGAVFGAVGAFIAYAFEKAFKTKTALKIIPIIFVVASTQVSQKIVMPAIYRSAGPSVAINTMKQSRLFQVIFKFHPESEAETSTRMQKILLGPKTGQSEAARALGSEIANRYFEADMLNASDVAVHRILQTSLNMTTALESKPETCVGMYLATPGTRVEEVPQGIMTEQLEAKADVIETAFIAPSPPPKNITIDQIAAILGAAYQRNNIDVNELSNLADLTALPPPKACTVIGHFLSTLASMSNKDGAMVFKGLIIAGKS